MHECPECGMTCRCHGDITDLLLDDPELAWHCKHCDEDEPESEPPINQNTPKK